MNTYSKKQLLALLHDGELGKAAYRELHRRGYALSFRRSGGSYRAILRKTPAQKRAATWAILLSVALVAAIITLSFL